MDSSWRELAEHVAESLRKGMRAVVTGRLRQREYETTEGEKRTVYEVDADDVGPSLRWATAKVAKAAHHRTRVRPAAAELDRSQIEEDRSRAGTPTKPAVKHCIGVQR